VGNLPRFLAGLLHIATIGVIIAMPVLIVVLVVYIIAFH
jgi:hypothetical protein